MLYCVYKLSERTKYTQDKNLSDKFSKGWENQEMESNSLLLPEWTHWCIHEGMGNIM